MCLEEVYPTPFGHFPPQIVHHKSLHLQQNSLDAQHLLWRMYLGHILHPKIPITEGMKIAELGTGNGYASAISSCREHPS